MLPSFGVPDRIPKRDVAFVVLAGIPLAWVFLGMLGMAEKDLGIAPGPDDPVTVVGTVAALGAGPAIAYHFQRRLRSSRVSLRRGCAWLVGWTILLAIGAAVAGWLGVGLAVAYGGRVMLRLPSGDDVTANVDALSAAMARIDLPSTGSMDAETSLRRQGR